jgi:hypothetical protein
MKTEKEFLPRDIRSKIDGKPDYRRFAYVLERDIKVALGELVRYALFLSEDEAAYVSAASPGTKQIFDEMLEDMVSLLGIDAKDMDEQSKRLVSPREFTRSCLDSPEIDDQFRVLASRLKSLKVKQQTEVDYVLTEYLKSTNYKGGMPGLQRFMKEFIGAEFVKGNKYKWKDPEGTSFTKSKGRLANRLTELKKITAHSRLTPK